MNEVFPIIILILCVAFLVVSIWNAMSLQKIKKQSKRDSAFEGKELYFDLKYKIQLITTIVSIIVGVLTYYGFTSIDKMNAEINNQVTERLKKFDKDYSKLILSMDTISKELNSLRNDYNESEAKQKKISAFLAYANKDIAELYNEVTNLNKQEIYIIKNYPINTDIRSRIYFKDLKTDIGKSLPQFNKNPAVFIPYLNDARCEVIEVTTAYFDVVVYLGANGTSNFNIWIVD